MVTMNSVSTKVIAILGATGNQGGSVVSTFLDEPGWKVRAITRNSASAKAQTLAARGAEVVQADMDVPSTLLSAFQGANAIFAVSDFWGLYGDPANKDRARPGQPLNEWAADHETQQLKNVIGAAAQVSTLERFVFSSLSNATKWSQGKYTHVYHFDSKAKAEDWGKKNHPELWAKTSVFQAGFFLSNFITNPILQPLKANGVVQFPTHLDPEVKLPFIAAEEDSGPIVKALVQEQAGKNLIGYREWLTLREMTQAFAKATGMKAEVVMLPKGQPRLPSIPSELNTELEDNWAYWNEYGYEARADPTVIHPSDVKSFPKLDSVVNYFQKQHWGEVLKA